MGTILSGANLNSTYWSYAIQHAVYIKHRLTHQALTGIIALFERFTSRRLDLSHIRVFGSHVIMKQPRVHRYKLDKNHTTTGTFIIYTSTDRTV